MGFIGLRFLPSSMLALLALSITSVNADDDDSGTTTSTAAAPTITTAPIYLPAYNDRAWSFLRGSILSTDASAHLTTFTIFCPAQTPPAPPVCDLSLEFPFIIVEGTDTVEFHGTVTSTFIADVECALKGTTQAACSGYSSLSSGFVVGHHTGPTVISWTSTFTGSDVQWGTLTLTDTPTATDDSIELTGSSMVTPTDPSGMMFQPSPTKSMGYSIRSCGYGAMAGILSSALTFYLLL